MHVNNTGLQIYFFFNVAHNHNMYKINILLRCCLELSGLNIHLSQNVYTICVY